MSTSQNINTFAIQLSEMKNLNIIIISINIIAIQH
jgi:hypothetical protein